MIKLKKYVGACAAGSVANMYNSKDTINEKGKRHREVISENQIPQENQYYEHKLQRRHKRKQSFRCGDNGAFVRGAAKMQIRTQLWAVVIFFLN